MAISSASFPAVSALSTYGIQTLETQDAALQAAQASDTRADSYAGLGSSRYQVLGLAPAITQVQAWQQNVSTAQTTLTTTGTALSGISSIATALRSTLIGLEGDDGAASLTAAATQAASSLEQLAGLVNTRNGSDYVFSGTASDTAPVPAADAIGTGTFFQAVGAAVGSLGANGAAATQAAIAAAAGNDAQGQSPFATALSVAPDAAAVLVRSVPTGDGETATVGVVATAGTASDGSTSGTASTGSAIRDLFGVLAAVANLGQAGSSTADLSGLASSLATWTGRIGDQLTEMAASVGSQQDVLEQRASSLSQTGDALTTRLGTLRDADLATVSTQVSAIQNQLTASYSLIADDKTLSLASFL